MLARARTQSNPQLDGAFEYLKKVAATELDVKVLEESSGVGVLVSCRRLCTCCGPAALLWEQCILQASKHSPGVGTAGCIRC